MALLALAGVTGFGVGLVANSIDSPDSPDVFKQFPFKTATFGQRDIRFPHQGEGLARFGIERNRNPAWTEYARTQWHNNSYLRSQEYADEHARVNTRIQYGTRSPFLDYRQGMRGFGPKRFIYGLQHSYPRLSNAQLDRLVGVGPLHQRSHV